MTSLKDHLRGYLLGDFTDEKANRNIEARLLSDVDFQNDFDLAEDDLIDDYVSDLLGAADRTKFEKMFFPVPERAEKIDLAFALKSLAEEAENKAVVKESPRYWKGWSLSLKFASIALICCAVAISIAGLKFLSKQNGEAEIAALQTKFDKSRPVESRLPGFKYAQFSVLRGAAKPATDFSLVEIESKLKENVRANPNAKNLYALGIYDLTAKKFDEAIENLNQAAQFSPPDTKIHGALGAALFEKAKIETDENKNSLLEKSLAEFDKALEIDQSNLETEFNRALCLQEMKRGDDAKTAWNSYLQNDPNSSWANDAREKLKLIS